MSLKILPFPSNIDLIILEEKIRFFNSQPFYYRTVFNLSFKKRYQQRKHLFKCNILYKHRKIGKVLESFHYVAQT